jgi:hypothetical protein
VIFDRGEAAKDRLLPKRPPKAIEHNVDRKGNFTYSSLTVKMLHADISRRERWLATTVWILGPPRNGALTSVILLGRRTVATREGG